MTRAPHHIEIVEGDGPIVLGLPHTGTYIPDDIRANLNANGRAMADTDWHIDRLYDDLLPGTTSVKALFHRYVIDANRDPNGKSLYPGQNTTGLVPLTDFDGHDIWATPPTQNDISVRQKTFHAPYHAALDAQLNRVKQRHGFAILYDCHSIRSEIAFLFDGTLPDFNIGTNNGETCDPCIETAVTNICTNANDYSTTINGRFKGGWTTRHYGRPNDGVHAIQMELAQSTYLSTQTAPFDYDVEKAAHLRVYLREILQTLTLLAPRLTGPRG